MRRFAKTAGHLLMCLTLAGATESVNARAEDGQRTAAGRAGDRTTSAFDFSFTSN